MSKKATRKNPYATKQKPPKKKEVMVPVVEYDTRTEGNSPSNLAQLDFEKEAASVAAGKEAEVYGVWGGLWKLWKKYIPEHIPHPVKKAPYLWLLLFTGWFGGHRYYEKRWILGIAYTLLAFTGVSFIMAVLDAVAVLPLPKDENGCVNI